MKPIPLPVGALVALLALSSAPQRVHAQDTRPRGVTTLSLDAGYGWYGHGRFSRDNDQRRRAREAFGLHQINDAGLGGYSLRAAIGRVTKNRKLRWGVSLYYARMSRQLDTAYTIWDAGEPTDIPVYVFNEFDLTDENTYPNVFLEPRLYHRGRFELSGHVSVGIAFLVDETILSPIRGGTVVAEARRLSNANLVEFQNAYGLRFTYRLNPYYDLFASARHNWLFATQTNELVEATVGIELNLRRGGVELPERRR